MSLFSMNHLMRRSLAALLLTVVAVSAAADPLTVTGTSDSMTYARGRANTYVLDLYVISPSYGGADALYFTLPPGVILSAARLRNVASWCAEPNFVAIGTGTGEGGWYQLGYPFQDGCGHFSGMEAPGMEQIVIIDVDVPAGYVGDLPIVVNALGDGVDDPPYLSSFTLTMTDDGSSPVGWSFDDIPAPALPSGWSSSASGAGAAWVAVTDSAHTPPNAVHAPTPAASGEAVLTTPAVPVPVGGAELQFRQRFTTDAGQDGGVLEISIDGGAFHDLVAAGGALPTGAYTGTLDASDCPSDPNPLAGRNAWSGSQAAFKPVVATLPVAAAGRHARFRWRLGTDCDGAVDTPNGWWIDDVRIVPSKPTAALPLKLAATIEGGAQWTEPLAIGNAGGGSLDYLVTATSSTGGDPAADCANPADMPEWLHIDAGSGSVFGGTQAIVPVTLDGSALPAGSASAVLCVATSDAVAPLRAISLNLTVTSDTCAAPDRLFANGFDNSDTGSCGNALRTFDERAAFLAQVADFHEDGFNLLRDGYVNGPIHFGGNGYTYAVTALPHTPDLGDMYLFPGAGVLSTTLIGPDARMTIKFTGAPVTALGGNFWGQMFLDGTGIEQNLQPEVSIELTLGDGSVETFIATSQQDFRGFVTTKPITSLTVAAPQPAVSGYDGHVWGVFDNLMVGSAR